MLTEKEVRQLAVGDMFETPGVMDLVTNEPVVWIVAIGGVVDNPIGDRVVKVEGFYYGISIGVYKFRVFEGFVTVAPVPKEYLDENFEVPIITEVS